MGIVVHAMNVFAIHPCRSLLFYRHLFLLFVFEGSTVLYTAFGLRTASYTFRTYTHDVTKTLELTSLLQTISAT